MTLLDVLLITMITVAFWWLILAALEAYWTEQREQR